ncbi:MAG: hypothetical protein ACE5R6_18695 [Candidatus Heimdallarchaeota archaeon]
MEKSQKELHTLREKKEMERPQIVPYVLREAKAQQVLPQLRKNDRIVLEALIRVAYATRSQLVRMCGLPRSTIYDSLIRLQRIGVVDQDFEERKTRGRPKTIFRII